MKLTLVKERDTLTGEPVFVIRKDGEFVALKTNEDMANVTFDKFVTAQIEMKKSAEKEILKSVEI